MRYFPTVSLPTPLLLEVPVLLLDTLKIAGLPVSIWLLNRFYARKDKANDEVKAEEKKALADTKAEEKKAMEARAAAAEKERQELRTGLHDLINRVIVVEGRGNTLGQHGERLAGELLGLRQQLDALALLVSKNEMNVDNIKDSVRRLEGTFASLLARILEK